MHIFINKKPTNFANQPKLTHLDHTKICDFNPIQAVLTCYRNTTSTIVLLYKTFAYCTDLAHTAIQDR